MNKKAENFKKYLDDKKIKAFTVDEIKDDQFQTVVFRSAADINGNRLPLIVILDTSIYGMIRVLVAPKVLHDDNETAVLKLLNTITSSINPLNIMSMMKAILSLIPVSSSRMMMSTVI